MLNINEVVICRPSWHGHHTYTIKRRTAQGVQKLDVIARTGRDAIEIAHLVFDGKSDCLRPVFAEVA